MRVKRTYEEALIGASPTYLTGAFHLKSPTGGFAKGIPRYSLTSVLFFAACPVTTPLVVFTICPTAKFCVATGEAEANATMADKAATKRTIFTVFPGCPQDLQV
jgi:hypothetical protein